MVGSSREAVLDLIDKNRMVTTFQRAAARHGPRPRCSSTICV
jgi:hypothetical protein